MAVFPGCNTKQNLFLCLSLSLALSAPVLAQDSIPTDQSKAGSAASESPADTPANTSTETSAASPPATAGDATPNNTVESNGTGSAAQTGSTGSKTAEIKGQTNQPHQTHNESKSTPAGSQPLKLYGRIEELCAGAGAKIPLKMQAMTPIRDASLDAKGNALAGKASVQSFPTDFRGTWSGELQVYTANFDKSYWEFDRAEADKESQLLRPGTKGRCTVTFYQGSNNRTELQPCEVVFTTMVNASEQMRQMMGGASPFGAFLGGGNNPMMANMQVPYMYALHLGNLTSGTGVTGNQLNSQLMKNTVKELARGVIEQEVVTRDSDRNPSTGKVKTGYSESVLRFTRMSSSRLYLQAASVSYRSDGKFQNKVILYGTLDRSVAPNSYPSPYGTQANPFGAMPGMGGGAGALQQEFQQMQKLMQQMGGR